MEVDNMKKDIDTIDLLARREIEARILAPLIEAFCTEFGADKTEQLISGVITRLAEQHGKELAEACSGNSLHDFASTLELFSKNGACEMQLLELKDSSFSFNMTKCRYVDIYKALGNPKLGVLLSCNRDYALCRGFNPRIKLTRTKTIMEGAEFCDFRFTID